MMLELDIQIEEKPLGLENRNFNRPIMMYHVHKEYTYLTTFVILDFVKGKIIYIKTLTPENVKKVEGYHLGTIKDSSHSSTFFDINKGFFNFLAQIPLRDHNSFRYIDLQAKKMRCYFGEDLGFKNTRFCETARSTDPNYIVVSLDNQEENTTYHIKCSLDMQDISLIGKVEARYSPHANYYHDGKVFTTEFFERRYRTKEGDILRDDFELENYFNEKFKNPPDNVMDKLCSDMVTIDSGRGEIKQINPDGRVITYETDFCPSHIETDGDIFYISSHNFISIRNYGKMLYLGPAAINRYRYDGEKLVFEGKFQNEKAYRFSEHKTWRHKGHPYVTTFGHPNRLVVIDGESMDLKYCLDLLDSCILDENDDTKCFLNTYRHDIEDPLRISTMEVSKDGLHGVFLSFDDINILNLETKEIVDVAPLPKEEGFMQKTYHSETI